jgi:hypothetical protein
MTYKFLCQDCLKVVVSDNWDKYHNTLGSCPMCRNDHADMCGCPECLRYITDNGLMTSYVDFDERIYE